MNLFDAEHAAQNLLNAQAHAQNYEVRAVFVQTNGKRHHGTYLDPWMGIVKLDCLDGFVTTRQLRDNLHFVEAEELQVKKQV